MIRKIIASRQDIGFPRFLLGLLLSVGVASAAFAVGPGAPAQTPVGPPAPPAAAPKLEPEIRQALGRMLNTSSAGLVERTRNGVTSVELQRRFHMAPVATVDAKGDVHIMEYSDLPPEPAQAPPP